MKYRIITNNPKVMKKYEGLEHLYVDFFPADGYRDILVRVRSEIQKGWHLITHPLSSNLKPMQCPYKTVVLSESECAGSFLEDEIMIEQCIATVDKLTGGDIRLPGWPERVLSDFQTVDLAVIQSAMERPLLQQYISAGK
ncbi:MAG: GrdX family protein [Eubacterium sp.]